MPTPNSNENRDEFVKRCIPMVMDEGHESDQAAAMCHAKFDEHMKSNAKKPIIAVSAPVTITAGEGEGQTKGPPKFEATFYTGGALDIDGWDLPVIVDLAGLKHANVLVANLDHDRTKRVGNFSVNNDGKSLVAHGTASARTAARDEVVGSAEDGYQWQASLEVRPHKVDVVKKGKTAQANTQVFPGPLYMVRESTLKGFGFVSHGADDNTSVKIAAIAASQKEHEMDPELKTWIEAMLPGTDVDTLSAEAIVNLTANYEGRNGAKPTKRRKLDETLDAKQAEIERVDAIVEVADVACDRRPYDIDAIKKLAGDAIDGKWTVEKFRLELLEASIPPAHSVFAPRARDKRLTDKVIEAAICMTGRLADVDKKFDDQTLQMAHDRFRNGIGLKELFVLAAQANGYSGRSGYNVDIEVQRAAFGMTSPRTISAAQFSTLSLPNTLANTANKFMREGWMAVDQTPLRIAAIKTVRDFKTNTTVSLTGAMQFELVPPGGELKHGTVGEETYTNKADTYGVIFAVNRTDIINDDLDALTALPRRIGRGGMLTLNHIFWTEFLNNSAFFVSTNSNVNTGVADVTVGGLAATEVIFMNQTDPDGKPLGVMPRIILVPTGSKAAAQTLMTSERLITGATSVTQGDGNIWRDRFRVESSPYMSNTAYTGYDASAWYMLADPGELPVIEIAALNGRVEPTVETADADFNVLGVQMRGYSDVGVNLQEYRGGVRADGGSS